MRNKPAHNGMQVGVIALPQAQHRATYAYLHTVMGKFNENQKIK
jgi:hypothetical protein